MAGRYTPGWLISSDAAELLSTINGRKIPPSYIYVLARRRRIRTRRLFGRICLYNRSDVIRYHMRPAKVEEKEEINA